MTVSGGSPALPPIADYALIGDGRTAALCSTRGSIDWLCLPRFDGEPVFGRLVGGDDAGHFSLIPEGVLGVARSYRPGSAVLETTWRVPGGELTLIEGMALEMHGGLRPHALLVRRLVARGAPAAVTIAFEPRLGIRGGVPPARRHGDAALFMRGRVSLSFEADPPVAAGPGRPARVVVEPGRPVTFVLGMSHGQPHVFVSPRAAFDLLERADAWWRTWSARSTYGGPARAIVLRSLITLRLLTYVPAGSSVAAPTTSLPEELGGSRNWDYRFSWPRDAAIATAACLGVGMSDEAHSFLHWLMVAGRLTRPRLHVAYTLDGKPGSRELELFDIPGYRGSTPVRFGNAAAEQHQLDVYGWVVDAAWALERAGSRLHRATWRQVCDLVDFVARRWRDPDAGIWEVRGEPSHYVHSKLMGWLALDRGLRMAAVHPTRAKRLDRWRRERAGLARDVRARGYDHAAGHYVRSYGSHELDAALLVLPVLGLEPPGSPAVAGTVAAIHRELSAGGPLLYRYPPGSDGLCGGEGAFLPCSFWLVQALAGLGRIEEATSLFAELCALGNDVGLFAEEMDPVTHEHLGNFPQALTHGALIQAALALSDAVSTRRPPPLSPA